MNAEPKHATVAAVARGILRTTTSLGFAEVKAFDTLLREGGATLRNRVRFPALRRQGVADHEETP